MKNRFFGLQDPTFREIPTPPSPTTDRPRRKKKYRDGTGAMRLAGAREGVGGEGCGSHQRRLDGGGARGRGDWGVGEEAGKAFRHLLLPREHRLASRLPTCPRELVDGGRRQATARGKRRREGGRGKKERG